jgi:hypothetical protein
MKNFFSQISLKRIFSLFTFGTIALLLVVIFFAGKQYLLYRQCESLVQSSQHILFQFTGIKEHINETFLANTPLDSSKIIPEIQGLDDELTYILKDVLIPEEFKLNFISQVDLVHLTVNLRNIQNSNSRADRAQKAKLTIQLRTIHAKLTAFNQLITRYTQKQLLGLHKALVGLLTLIIAIVSLMLLIINQYITSPILHYCKALFPKEKDTISLFTLHKSIENMASRPSAKDIVPNQDNVNEMSRLYRNSSIGNLLGGISNELTNRSNGILNYTQAILDLSQDLQLDHDSRVLLQKLFTEEKKMSKLLMHMIQFTCSSEDGAPKSLSLEELFSPITGLVQGTLKNDRIDLHIKLSNPSRILNYHVSDLQLVILSALQSSRVALNNSDTREQQHDTKKIQVSFTDERLAENRVIIVIEDNGAPWKTNIQNTVPVTERPWHNMRFCNDFLQTFGGSLQLNRKNGSGNQCVIDIPFRGKRG